MIGNILENTTELYMIKYTFGEIFSSGGATLYKKPSVQTVKPDFFFLILPQSAPTYQTDKKRGCDRNWCRKKMSYRFFTTYPYVYLVL